TLLNILSGLDTDFEGEVAIQERRLGAGAKRTVRTGYLFQEPRLLPWLTVRRNVEFALDAVGIARAEWGTRVDRWLTLVGLEQFADFYPLQLSGGMQQRTAIARAFAVE